ncbi:hypothetical protein KDK_19180 [Dictyobacter kobayashii]|uniref:Uncharacterized protein n=1 Tax=Dictyobacter kobayashii TaxID=2014872 RepID=A0A402AG70_9CHLR|nr:hypothetical protein KDK_19180 [Dictyobacter kobayashii]
MCLFVSLCHIINKTYDAHKVPGLLSGYSIVERGERAQRGIVTYSVKKEAGIAGETSIYK